MQTSPERENTGTQPEPVQDIQEVTPIEPAKTPKSEPKVPEVVKAPEPVYPSFDEQLKEIRETYAKDYETKMTRGIIELDEIKKDYASKQ